MKNRLRGSGQRWRSFKKKTKTISINSFVQRIVKNSYRQL